MRKTLTALLLATALPTVVFAAPNGEHMNGMPHAKGHCMAVDANDHAEAKALKALDLSPEQREKLHNARRTQAEKNFDVTQRYLNKLPAADKAAMEKELQTIQDQQNKALRDALNPEQQKRYDEVLKQQEKQRAERAEFEAWKAARDAKKTN